ncbi:MAG: DUF3224 domain-containing protein [Pseudomonadota bacterium]
MTEAKGQFTVSLTPQDQSTSGPATLGRMTIAKVFEGDMIGTSTGEMLTVRTPVDGSAVYVAVEAFEGSLAGLAGGFALSHRGVMSDGGQSLVVEIVPDSGSGALAGISGSMTIDITGGDHAYTLMYDLPDREDAGDRRD